MKLKCTSTPFRRSWFVICDFLDLDPFLFQGPLLLSVLFQANIDLFEMFSSASLVTIKRSLPLSRHKNTMAISFTIEQSRVMHLSMCKAREWGGGGIAGKG